ncbi:MAG: hypothetical protein ACPGPE_10055, partial [Planctomycetota bacterium]
QGEDPEDESAEASEEEPDDEVEDAGEEPEEEAAEEVPEEAEELMTAEERERILDRNRRYQESGEELRRILRKGRKVPARRDW